MAKELPYFKFEPAEYLTKNISFCSLSAQGLFINICAYYWQRNCKITKEQLLKRLNYENEFNELILEGVIDLKDEFIVIKFLDKQLYEVKQLSNKNRVNGAKGGRPKNPNKTQIKPKENPNINPNESQTKGIREDNIREEKIINNNSIELSEKIDFSALLNFFNETFKKNNRVFADNVKKKYNGLMKQGYTKENIVKAMLKAKGDKFHIDNNYQYCTLEYFARPNTMDKYGFDNLQQSTNYIPTR